VEQTYPLQVTREGFIVIPSVGQLSVANLTMEQLRELLYTRLGKAYSGVRRGSGATTKFDVSITQLRTNQVYVVGDVSRPGSYQMASSGTVLSALYAAGGPTENGNFRRIDIRRGGKLIDSLDLYDYLLRGDNSHDIRLQTGDVVFVPPHGARVKIAGQIIRPAIYELKTGESLADLIAAAGGFTAEALQRRVQIHRVLPPDRRSAGGRDRVVLDLPSDQFAAGGSPAFAMAAGDSVQVFAVADRQRQSVLVLGDVWIPGVLGFTPGLKLAEAIRLAGGPKPDVYLGSILVSRLRSDSSRIQLRSSFADSTGAVTDDLALQDDDEIEVFGRTSFRPTRWIAVTGAILNAGQVPYREGMTLRDAVLLAGGLTEDALINEVEIARLPADRTGGRLAVTLRVPMDSTYLVDRGRDGAYSGPPGIGAPASGARETVLQPYDNVLIFRQPDWELQRIVSLTGQVLYPGRYALVSKSDRITDLLNRAGGLTPNAYPDAIRFFRTADRTGRVGVDLPRVLKDSTFRDNLILIGGDSITIPEFDPIVYVSGAVNAPVAVSYVPGKDIDFYVQAAGGYTLHGDKSRAYTTQPSGKVQSVRRKFFLPDYRPKPRAGAKVFVPEKLPEDKSVVLATVGSITQIMASLVAIVVLATRK
ncbi:MAG: SLBB domain-containing protein, partial [Gemmatimonadota bacterium]